MLTCRRVLVVVAGRGFGLEGERAELVALIAAADLSDRSVQLLRKLVANEPEIAAISCGNLDVVLTQTRATVYRRQQLPKREIGRSDDDAA